MLYQSKALENYNKSGIRIYHGKISESIVEKNDDVFNINYDFKKFNNMGLYFKGEVAFSENEINQIKTEIEPYKDSIIAVCDFDSKRKYSEEYHLKCFFKDTTYIDNNLIRYLVHIYIFADTGIDTLYELKKITGMDYNSINFNDKKIWDIFSDYNKIFCYMPSYFNRSLFQQIQPRSLEELCAIYGLTKSTFDFEEGKDLVEQIIKMKEYSTRDDIYSFLLSKDIEKEIAFEIIEFIRRGKANNIKYSEQWYKYEKIMKKHNIDTTYIKKCKKIKYLFPKSNILNSVVYIIKHIAYMAYYPEITEKVISKCPRLF